MLIGTGYNAGHCDKHQYNQSSLISKRVVALSEHVVLIGACGWQHKDWTGEFYPDDLPEEWQLGYYGNEYQVVMVPASYWAAKPETIEEWLEESDESLRMICEWPAEAVSQAQIKKAQQGINAVSDRVLAILIPLDTEVSVADLVIYKELAETYPLCFDVATEQRERLIPWLAEHFAGFDYGICWRAEQAYKQDLALGSVSVTRISGEVEPKALRMVLETMVAESSTDRNMALIVDGEPPSMQLLTNAGIILDLL